MFWIGFFDGICFCILVSFVAVFYLFDLVKETEADNHVPSIRLRSKR
jgi:hypothetical protein